MSQNKRENSKIGLNTRQNRTTGRFNIFPARLLAPCPRGKAAGGVGVGGVEIVFRDSSLGFAS